VALFQNSIALLRHCSLGDVSPAGIKAKEIYRALFATVHDSFSESYGSFSEIIGLFLRIIGLFWQMHMAISQNRRALFEN